MSAHRLIPAALGLLFLSSTVLVAVGAPDKRGKKPESVPFTVLASGHFSNIQAPLEAAVRDPLAWEALWAIHAGGIPPVVDFDQEIVVAVFLGMRATPRFSVSIDTVLPAEDGGYLVRFLEQEIQHKKRVFSDIMATPFVIAVVPRTEGPVTFEGTKVIVKRIK